MGTTTAGSTCRSAATRSMIRNVSRSHLRCARMAIVALRFAMDSGLGLAFGIRAHP